MTMRWGKMIQDAGAMISASTAGFDYIQARMDIIMENATDRRFEKEPAPEICSALLPANAYVTQQGFNIYAWTEYLKKAVRSVAESGCRKLAWSNGRARVVPLEGDRSGAEEQVLQFLYLLCDIAGNFDITVLVEPLGPQRTNFLNSMQEISSFLPLVGKNNISSMISLRELSEIGLSYEDFPAYGSLISHVNLENPAVAGGKRLSPREDDGYDYIPFFRALRGIGYMGSITLPEDADSATLSYCRRLWDAAG